MINAIVNFLLKIVLWLAGLIMSIITFPVFLLLGALFPDFSSFLESFYYFVDNYFVTGLAFAREVFLNVTGYPRPLLQALVTLLVARVTFHIVSIPIKFIINTFKMIRGSGGEMVE